MIDFEKYFSSLEKAKDYVRIGKIVNVSGITSEANGPELGLGSFCKIKNSHGKEIEAEVIGFRDNKIIVMPYGDLFGVSPGSLIIESDYSPTIQVGEQLLGRVLNGMGEPIDGKGPLSCNHEYPLYGEHINPLRRRIIRDVMDVGVCSINSLLTIGKGQRIGIMAGSGVGKSVLMGMIARHTEADVNVIALIGERGREVREFIENVLGEEGIKRSVVVVATSDMPALIRIRGAHIASAIAQFFMEKGLDVILMMDSITRFAMALREVGLSAGEPPTAKGYTPSVFSQIPRLLERVGNFEDMGSITALYNVLIEADDINDPIGDTVRSVVDGHILLSRELANKGIFPAIDVLSSISRVMNDIIDEEHKSYARRFKRILSTYKNVEDLINVGAYVDGSDPEIDMAKRMIKGIYEFLRQDIQEKATFNESIMQLKSIFNGYNK